MSSRSYPIWCEVEGTTRKEAPRFGSKDTLKLNIYVGSAKDSNEFVTIKVRKQTERLFGFYVDGILVSSFDIKNYYKIGLEALINHAVNVRLKDETESL